MTIFATMDDCYLLSLFWLPRPSCNHATTMHKLTILPEMRRHRDLTTTVTLHKLRP